MPTESDAIFPWLLSMGSPRPLVWQQYVYRRRMWYGFLCVALLLVVVGIPLVYGLQQMTETANWEKIRPNQIALVLGAVVVVAYVMFVHSLFKLYDDVKWLGQKGAVAEANILVVLRSPNKVIISYRFWDRSGKEREKDAVIDIDSKHPLSDLAAGMVVPILYDPVKPEQRSYLWAEAATYLTVK